MLQTILTNNAAGAGFLYRYVRDLLGIKKSNSDEENQTIEAGKIEKIKEIYNVQGEKVGYKESGRFVNLTA